MTHHYSHRFQHSAEHSLTQCRAAHRNTSRLLLLVSAFTQSGEYGSVAEAYKIAYTLQVDYVRLKAASSDNGGSLSRRSDVNYRSFRCPRCRR